MLTKVGIKTQHIALKKEAIPVRLLSPIVVARLLPYFVRLSAYGQIPGIGTAAKGNKLDRVPEILAKSWVGKKTPILVFPQQLVAPVRRVGANRRFWLGLGMSRYDKQPNCRQDKE